MPNRAGRSPDNELLNGIHVFNHFVAVIARLSKAVVDLPENGKLILVDGILSLLELVGFAEPENQITIACNGAGGRVGFENKTPRAGPLMRIVIGNGRLLDMHLVADAKTDGRLF